MFRLGTLVAIALALAAIPVSAGAAPPAPCNNAPQITDANGDGHHDGTDVLAAWWSEAAGRLQLVIQVRSGVWVAQHDDAQINGAGFEARFWTGAGTAYLRALAPAQDRVAAGMAYDYGVVAADDSLQSQGTTTGVTETGANGTVTIDVPAGLAPSGTRLIGFRVFTYDGINDGVKTAVDHAPGGTQANDSARGADYVVGSCNPASAPTTTTAVGLTAPSKVTGRKTVTISGTLSPARAGVPVAIASTANGKTTTTTVTSAADGAFSTRLAIAETTRLRATAEGIGSKELTVTAHTKVKIKVSNRKDGSAVVTGTVDPKLPGRVQWLRSTAVTPSARTTTRNGTFRLRLKHPRPGRYQAVVIPTGGRAERATSNTGVIR